MKSKPSLKNSAKAALLFNVLLFYFCGCSGQIEPSYKEKDIPYLVKKICKDEYNLDVATKRTTNTLWIYAPLNKILDKEFGTNKDKIFDEEMTEKLRNILTAVGRVLVSSDNAPEFYALLASDINVGLDYTIIGNVLDTKKSYAGFLPWTEANKRYVMKINISPQAIGDKTGVHLEAYDIQLPQFLAEQIAQRLETEFNQGNLKDNFKIKPIEANFKDKRFVFKIEFNKLNASDTTDITQEAFKISSFVLQEYDFKDFLEVQINEVESGKSTALNQKALFEDFK